MVGYRASVGMRNYLIEGVSGTGKTSVCKELRRRGLHAINGDTDLAYEGNRLPPVHADALGGSLAAGPSHRVTER
jgi:adenylate kinase